MSILKSIRGAGLAASVLVLALGGARAEEAAGSAEALVESATVQTIDAIRNDKAVQAGDFARLQKIVDERVVPHIDFDRMTRLSVGKSWRAASEAQRKALVEQFRLLLLHTYSNALAKVNDHKVRMLASRPSQRPDETIVRTQVVPSQGEPISLDYRAEKIGSEWKIYDISVLGVWLVENYRNEFSEIVSRDGVDGLVKTLVEKNRAFSASKAG